MSFLAYILRGSANVLRPHQNAIPDFVIRLLRDCPPEAAATRKVLPTSTAALYEVCEALFHMKWKANVVSDSHQ